MSLRAQTLSGIPEGFLLACRKMLRTENREHNSLTLRQVFPVFQRIFLRAKRKPAPGIQARLCPETHRRWELTELKARGYSLNSGSKLL